ncbi:formylglycine-generating enzyme family protein [bacterium]|nr:formylglycine-generating enzyme family protein [bacterium]MBU1983869.1 formylglycine-generating enzyme family protein [bacterium]
MRTCAGLFVVLGILVAGYAVATVPKRKGKIIPAPAVIARAMPDCNVQVSWPRTNRIVVLERKLGNETLFSPLEVMDTGTSHYIDSTVPANQIVVYRLVPQHFQYLSEIGKEAGTMVSFPAPPAPSLRRVAVDSVVVTVSAWHEFALAAIIERRIHGVYAEIGRIPPKETEFLDGGMSVGGYQRYRLRYQGSTYVGPPSASDSILLNLDPPVGLLLTDVDDHTVRLSWESASELAAASEVEKRSVDGVFRYRLSKGTSTWTDSERRAGAITLYSVRFICNEDSSDFSRPVSSDFILEPVTGLAADSIHDLAVRLAWSPPRHNATSYVVERSTDSLSYASLAVLPAGVHEYADTTVSRGQRYFYRVRSLARDGTMVFSKPIVESIPSVTRGMVLVSGEGQGASFYMDALEVTVEQYVAFCHATRREPPPDPGFSGYVNYWTRPTQCPAVNVSWKDALQFCNWRSTIVGLQTAYDSLGNAISGSNGFRLPSRELYWRAWACRSDSVSNLLDADDGWETVCCAPMIEADFPHVRHLKGNVWEWVEDMVEDSARMVLGGSYCTPSNLANAIPEFCYREEYRSPSLGFRCVLYNP